VTTLINPKGLAESFNLTIQYILHVLVYSSSHDPFFSFWPKLLSILIFVFPNL